MSIKKKLQLSLVVTGGMALLVFGLILVWTSRQVSEAIEQSKAIDKVVRGVFELNIITHDYLLHHEERAQVQWQLRYGSLAQILTEVGAKYPEKEEILDRVIQDHAEIQSLFSQLVTSYEDQGSSEIEQRLASQLAVKAQTMVADTFRLAETARARVESAQGTGSFLLMASGVIVLTLMVSTIVLVGNNIVARITNLHRGTEIIAAGDLDYQVDVGNRDEIGDLAHAFNEMTRQLRESYGALEEEITERKRAEEALKEYSERLEEMVEERTKELRDAQEQLVRREKLAVLGQLSGGVGHELRNPLGVISNAVYFLQMVLADAGETTREYLGIIGSEVHTAEKIVSDLLDLSRTRPAEREEAALSDLVAEALERHPLPEGVELTTRIASDLPAVFVDRLQMKQVLANLVANAYHAMPDGGELALSARVDGGRVCLSVADTGCGIPPENMGKIFEPLFTTRARGIGLGLAVSRNLVQVNEGTIEVQSEEGRGSTFTVALPARDASRARPMEVVS